MAFGGGQSGSKGDTSSEKAKCCDGKYVGIIKKTTETMSKPHSHETETRKTYRP
jgi:hypothetical protein